MANTIATDPGVAISPSGQLASSANYMTAFDYSNQYDPDTFVEMYPQYGNGKLTSFCDFMGMEIPFASDKVIWTEQGRLHRFVEGATVTTDSFDCGSNEHNVRVGDTIWISDGTKQLQADVYEITSKTVFKAHNRSTTGAFDFTGTVNLFVSSNEFAKKTDNFKEGHEWEPEVKENYPHIIKEFYSKAKSDLAQITWVTTPQGKDVWYQYEWERSRILFENKVEMTNVFNRRAVSGSAAANAGKAGMNGVVPQLEDGGNVGNGYIEELTDLDDWTKRLRKQGKTNVFTCWNDQTQNIAYNNLLGGINANYSSGANYGMFDNSPELALHLDFHSVTRNGYSFHFTRLDALDDPTLFGGDKFLDTGVGSLMVPGSETFVVEEGETVARPYLAVRKRKSANIDRSLEVKVLGMPQHPIENDSIEVHFLTEMTNQVIGANEWAVNFR